MGCYQLSNSLKSSGRQPNPCACLILFTQWVKRYSLHPDIIQRIFQKVAYVHVLFTETLCTFRCCQRTFDGPLTMYVGTRNTSVRLMVPPRTSVTTNKGIHPMVPPLRMLALETRVYVLHLCTSATVNTSVHPPT